MKKIILFLLSVFLFLGCKKDEETKEVKKEEIKHVQFIGGTWRSYPILVRGELTSRYELKFGFDGFTFSIVNNDPTPPAHKVRKILYNDKGVFYFDSKEGRGVLNGIFDLFNSTFYSYGGQELNILGLTPEKKQEVLKYVGFQSNIKRIENWKIEAKEDYLLIDGLRYDKVN